MSILKSFPARNIVLFEGPYNGTKLDGITCEEFAIKQDELTMGVYETTRNVVNDREVFEWKPNK